MSIDAGKETGGQVGRQAANSFASRTRSTRRQPGRKLITQEGVWESGRSESTPVWARACVRVCVCGCGASLYVRQEEV